MSYGHPIASGHGHRVPAYRWSPTVLPPSQRRGRHSGYTHHYSSVPRFRFSTAGRRASASSTSRSRPQRALPKREPSFGRLLGKGVVSLAGVVLKFLADEALAGRRITKSFESFLAFCILLAVMGSSAIGLVLGGLYLFVVYMDDFAGGAAVASMEEYDEARKRICITRKASVEAPPTPDELRRAWESARGHGPLTAKLLAGTLLSNLEPAVDQSYLRAEDGTIIGRRPGLKGWLRGYCPDLVPHYKALMSYKALADKLRVALGIEEPDTLSCIIDFGEMAKNSRVSPFRAASPSGDAAPVGGLKKGVTMKVDAAKDAGVTSDGGWVETGPLHFRKKFKLLATKEQFVVDAIHSMFGSPDPAEPGMMTINELGKTESGQEKRDVKGTDWIAKTSVFSGKNDTVGPWAEAEAATVPSTMAALEEAVREQLGLCWMRRAGRRPRPA